MPNIDGGKFVKLWAQAVNEGKDKAWVARNLQIPPSTLAGKYNQLKKRGVRFPDLPTGYRKIWPVDELNDILKKELKGDK